jgi:nucleotide-binding universal stress UspA family protein
MVLVREPGQREEPREAWSQPAYSTVVVPLGDDPDSLAAIPTACGLAAEDGGSIVGVFVIEVPTEIPLEAHMFDAERQARQALGRARAAAEAYGLRFSGRIVRAHGAADAIVAEAERLGAELIVMATRRRPVKRPGRPLFDETVRRVLGDAPCRVALVGLPPEEGRPDAER